MALHLATILGDLADHLVIVGGLVPYLIVDQTKAPVRHVGTRDLDLGLSLAVLDHERYREIGSRLRGRGFEPTRTETDAIRRQTWQLPQHRITVDFLIGRAIESAEAGSLQSLESDLAAIVTPALPLAFTDRLNVTIDGMTPEGERARRDVNVAGPAAFVALKAHAFHSRGENKDAYDLVYVLMNYGASPVIEVASRFVAIAEYPEAVAALAMLAEDFATEDHLGPKRYAEFLGDVRDIAVRQDGVGAVRGFLASVHFGGA